MTTKVEARYQDGKLLLSKPLPIAENTVVRLTIETDDDSDTARSAWLRVSEESLLSVWDNPADDVFNDLLAE
ncbi:MAG: antitoxin family protein [Bryobacteraceae bacterium]